ncbi:MAG: HAMP domain-containing sensor histidine kinase [Lachnospiraceae bacterium]|nr:HAMP domain-containing sensor histidine kinase [Lachnospiraceae bacterium]
MKLFRKIYFQVIIGFLVLALFGFSYLIYESQKQNLADIQQYEANTFSGRLSEMNLQLDQSHTAPDNERLQNITAVYAFRELFENTGGICRDGNELFNSSPYDYDYQELLEHCAQENGTFLPILQKAGKQRLLIFTALAGTGASGSFQIVYFKDVSDVFRRTSRLCLTGLLFTLFMLLTVGGLLYAGIYRTLKPLSDLESAAASIAGGAYNIRVQIPAGRQSDELTRLAESFNQMAESVEEHILALSRISEAQQQLLGSLAHELKTPMTAIIGYADMLLTVRLNDARREKALHYIESEGRRLSRLSAKMLELTGLVTGQKQICFQPQRVRELFAALSDLTAHRLSEKSILLEYECTPGGLSRDMDRDLMMSLLMNLVDNAFKASPPGSVIRLFADRYRICVRDTGGGMPAEEVSRVTEAFYMVNKSRSKSAGSVGLGLTLCRQIAAIHGAELIIESEPGSGTSVSVVWND